MTSRRITTVLGQLGLTQVRYVSPVRRGAARGLVGRVYDQVEQEFGVLAPSLALFSPSPQVLAASWLMLRETLLVTRVVGRADKEAVATAVSAGNTCPWCVTVHSTMQASMAAAAQLDEASAWARDCATEQGAMGHEPACPADQAPELIGTVILFHYFNRMVNVFLTEVPLPPGAPRMVLGPVMRVLDGRMRPAAEQVHKPQMSLEEAFGRGCTAIDEAGARSVPPPVRDLVMAELDNWHGEPRGPSRAWADGAVSALPPADQAAGRLALLTALASSQVIRADVGAFQAGQPGERALTELTAWASLAAARRVGAWIPRQQPAPR